LLTSSNAPIGSPGKGRRFLDDCQLTANRHPPKALHPDQQSRAVNARAGVASEFADDALHACA